MANRRMVGLLKMIRNVAFAHRSQHVQFGRFDTEEDVMRYKIDPFPWLLMTVYQLDQEHQIAGSVVTTASDASDKTSGSETAGTTDDERSGYGTDGAAKKANAGASASGGDTKNTKGKKAAQVRKTPSWPRSWANFSLSWLYSHWNAWANLHLLGQPNTVLASEASGWRRPEGAKEDGPEGPGQQDDSDAEGHGGEIEARLCIHETEAVSS
jgi:hypothetical protein